MKMYNWYNWHYLGLDVKLGQEKKGEVTWWVEGDEGGIRGEKLRVLLLFLFFIVGLQNRNLHREEGKF